MTTLSDVLAAKNPAISYSGAQTLFGPQADGDILVKGNLTVSGNFFLRGNLKIMGNLIFSGCTQFTVTGDLYVQYNTTGTLTGNWYVGGSAALDGQVENLGNATVLATPVFEPFTAATTTGTPTYNGIETTVTITTAILTTQTAVRVSPFTSDIFIQSILSSTQFTVNGDVTATFPNGTAIRVYNITAGTRVTFTTTISGSTNFISKIGSNVYVVTNGIGSNYVDLAGNVVATYPTNTVITTHSSNIGNSFNSFDATSSDMTFGKTVYIGAPAQLQSVGNVYVNGDLIGANTPSAYPGITLTFLKLNTPYAGTNLYVIGDIKNFSSIDISGGSSSATVSGGAGGTMVVLGSIGAPYKNTGFLEFTTSYAAITLTSTGGAFNGSTAFSGGAGGNIRVYGSINGMGTIALDGGQTSGGGGNGGAGGFLAVMGPIYGVGVVNATNTANLTSITAVGGSSSAGDGSGGAGGNIIVHSLHSLSQASVACSGGTANSASATSIGGAGGNVRIPGGNNLSSIQAGGGNCGLTGSAGGTIYLSGAVGANSVNGTGLTIQATGGRPTNTAVSRTGGVGGTINLHAVSGLIASITASGGITSGGTANNNVAGNGGLVNITNGNLTVTNITMNGGSSLTTTGSFAGSPGQVTATGNVIFGSVLLRTTGQTGISGTAPTSLATNKGQFTFTGNITVGTLDVPTITNARIAPISNANPTLLNVDTLTTKSTFEDHTGANPSVSQTSLCRTRIYKYNNTTGSWYAVTTTAI